MLAAAHRLLVGEDEFLGLRTGMAALTTNAMAWP